MSDEELMCKYQEGDVGAMDELLIRYRNPLYRFAFRLSRNAAEAEDIAQEVFLKIHQFRNDYRPVGKFRTWIFSIAHNLCISKIRRTKWLVFWPRKHDAPDELMDFESPDPSPQQVASGNEMSEIVKRCIQGLPFLQKEALILREYENLDYHEIGQILHKPVGTVKTLLYRARVQLKNTLLPYMGPEGGYNV